MTIAVISLILSWVMNFLVGADVVVARLSVMVDVVEVVAVVVDTVTSVRCVGT